MPPADKPSARLVGSFQTFQRIAGDRLCPICARQGHHYATPYPSHAKFFKDLVVLWCDQCGSGWMPDAVRVMAGYYSGGYSEFAKRHLEVPETVYSRESLAGDPRFARANAQLAELREQAARFETVYDFGFGLGFFLFATSAKRKLGFDIDPEVAPFAEYLSIETLAPWDIPDDSVDCLLTSHSLEHVEAERLDMHLQAFRAVLRPGGRLAVEVPHAALSWIVKPGTHRPHTLFFSAEGLERLFSRHGFSVLRRGFANEGQPAEPAPNAIYAPSAADAFHSSRNSSALFMVCSKPERREAAG